MYTTDGILNVTNWCALAIAISVPGICSFDAALERYYKGPEAKPKEKNKSRWDMVNEMYSAGSLGLKSLCLWDIRLKTLHAALIVTGNTISEGEAYVQSRR